MNCTIDVVDCHSGFAVSDLFKQSRFFVAMMEATVTANHFQLIQQKVQFMKTALLQAVTGRYF
jgi:hypothetical protein